MVCTLKMAPSSKGSAPSPLVPLCLGLVVFARSSTVGTDDAEGRFFYGYDEGRSGPQHSPQNNQASRKSRQVRSEPNPGAKPLVFAFQAPLPVQHAQVDRHRIREQKQHKQGGEDTACMFRNSQRVPPPPACFLNLSSVRLIPLSGR